MPPANASPAAGTDPDGSENVPSRSYTITTGVLLPFKAKANWIVSGPVAVAVSEPGASGMPGVKVTTRSLPSCATANVPPDVADRKLFVSTANRPAEKSETEVPPMIFQL